MLSTWLTRRESRTIENPNTPLTAENFSPYGQLGESGVVVSPRTAIQLSAVYACIRVLSDTLAQLPVSVYRKEGKNRTEQVGHPVNDLVSVSADDDDTSPASLWGAAMTNVCLDGNAYMRTRRNSRGDVLELDVLDSSLTTVVRDDLGRKALVNYEGGTAKALMRGEFVHVLGMSADGKVGMSPIAQQRRAIGLGLATHSFGEHLFQNSARTSLVLQRAEGLPSLKDPDYERLRNEFERLYAGVGNAGRTVILPAGMEAKPVSINPEDAQFLESRKFTVEEICRIYGVPPHKIAHLEHATFSNIEHQGIDFSRSFAIWCVRFEQALRLALFTREEIEAGFYIRWNLDALIRGDYENRMKGHATAVQFGLKTPNEARALEEEPPLEGGDQQLVPLTHTTIQHIEAGSNLRNPSQQRLEQPLHLPGSAAGDLEDATRRDSIEVARPMLEASLSRVQTFERRRLAEAKAGSVDQVLEQVESRTVEALVPLYRAAGWKSPEKKATAAAKARTRSRRAQLTAQLVEFGPEFEAARAKIAEQLELEGVAAWADLELTLAFEGD